MKKHLLSILSAITILSSVTIAQPVLTATGINPVVGDAYGIEFYTTAFSPGNSGANQTWNLMPAGTGTLIILDTYSPSSTPYASSFLAADVSLTAGTGSYDYYKTSSLVLRYYGYVNSNNTVVYNNPEEILRFPFNMSNTYADVWSATYNTGATLNGTTTVTYDGYGSVILPGGTYNNAVRIHMIQNIIFQSGGTPFSYSTDHYSWYLNGSHQPVASTYTTTVGSDTYPGSRILTNIVTRVNEREDLSSFITSFPNPAVNNINFEFDNVISVKAINIIDITGKTVYSKELSQSMIDKVLTINTTELSDGIYFANFKLEDGQIVTKKINILK